MGDLLSRQAYAKVNLHLAVGSPFADGYHPIESIFSLVDLSDRIDMSYSESDAFSIEVTGLEAYCEKGGDTLSKAAVLWYERSRLPLSLQVHCEKNIPVRAGLGGGSSDAAALLLLLQEASGAGALAPSELEEVALGVGSDVPFFLSGFSCALVEGRGERITALSVAPKPILLVHPRGYSVSTKEAYALLDTLLVKGGLGQRVPLERVLATLERKSHEWGGAFFNDFERCLDYPEFYGAVARIASRYVGYGSLSGSGSCWYFVGEDDKSVLELSRELHSRFLDSVQLWCTKLI
ncbi:MAG: hypothetical protein RBR15_10970 [Sphaerochaeta sp.]|nr:hypothetical protein [Sphaerochaeta sp.]